MVGNFHERAFSHVSHIRTESLASNSHFNAALLQTTLTQIEVCPVIARVYLVLRNWSATVNVEADEQSWTAPANSMSDKSLTLIQALPITLPRDNKSRLSSLSVFGMCGKGMFTESSSSVSDQPLYLRHGHSLAAITKLFLGSCDSD